MKTPSLLPEQSKYLVRLPNGLAVRFITTLHGRKVFETVPDDEATQFTAPEDARWMATTLFDLRPHTYAVEPISTINPQPSTIL